MEDTVADMTMDQEDMIMDTITATIMAILTVTITVIVMVTITDMDMVTQYKETQLAQAILIVRLEQANKLLESEVTNTMKRDTDMVMIMDMDTATTTTMITVTLMVIKKK